MKMENLTTKKQTIENSEKMPCETALRKMLRGKISIGLLAVFLLLVTAGGAGAATFRVTSGADGGVGSLRQAIQSANAENVSSIVEIDPSVKSIHLSSGSIAIDGDVVINGAGATIRGSKVARLFNISAGIVTFRNLTFTDGSAFTGGESGGAATIDSVAASVTFENCTFFGNFASGSGGAVHVYGAGSLRTVFINCTLTKNTATGSGGGVAVVGGVVQFIATLATGNGAALDADIHVASSGAVVASSYNVVGRTSAPLAGGSGNDVSVLAENVFKTPEALSTVDGVQVMELLSATANFALDKIPALNSYSLPSADQRGASRPQMSAIDVGAYELSPVALTGVKLNGSAYVELNTSENYAHTLTPENATLDVRGYANGLEWSVGDSRILSVDATGRVSGLALGTSTVKVTAHGWDAAGRPIVFEAAKTVTVGTDPLTLPTVEVSFTDKKLEMTIGQQHTAHVEIKITPDTDDYDVSFTSDNPEVASITQGSSASTSALIRALTAGESTIRVSVTARNSKGPGRGDDIYSLNVVKKGGGGGCNSLAGFPVVLAGLCAFFLRHKTRSRGR